MPEPDQLALDRDALSAAFPLCFRPRGQRKAPLKIGIDREVIAAGVPGLTPERIRAAIADYCAGPKYARAVAARHSWRIGLDGKPVERTWATHRMHARRRLAEMAAEPRPEEAAA